MRLPRYARNDVHFCLSNCHSHLVELGNAYQPMTHGKMH